MSRRTGLAALRNEPQAHEPLAPSEAVLEDADDVGREAAVRLAAEVGHVDGDAAAGLELPHALLEHGLEQLEVLEVRRGDARPLELLLVGLAGEVRG
jgi:hypothetical protein